MDYQLTQTGPEVQGILNQAPEVVAVGNLNTIDAVGVFYVTNENNDVSGLLFCFMSTSQYGDFYMQVYLNGDGQILTRGSSSLPCTEEWINYGQLSLDGKVDKRTGYGLSKNDFTDYYKGTIESLMSDVARLTQNKLAYEFVTELPVVTSAVYGKMFFLPGDNAGEMVSYVYYNNAWQKTGGGSIQVDNSLSTSSENPVQNKVVTTALNSKQDTINDLSAIRSGAAAGATAYQKPSAGIPKTDLASAVQESLGKADAAAPQASTYTKNEIDEIIESIGSPITEIQRSALDDTTTPGMYKVVGTTGSSAANSSWISLLLVSDYDFSMIGGSTNHIVTQRLFNGRGASDSVKIEERTKTNNGLWSEWVDIYGSDIDEIWEELDAKQDTISDLETIRSGASAGATAVQPAAMNTALAAKQDTLTFDNAPTANSNNPVKSGGVKTAIDAKQDTINTVNVTVDNNTGTPSGSASVSGGTLTLNFSNLKGATGVQGPQGIQGVQGVQGPKGDTGVTGDASSLAIIHGIDKTSSYGTTDVCGADAAQALLNEIEGGFYY